MIAHLTPTVTADDYADLPNAMRNARRWLLWRSEPKPDPTKKPAKVPYYVDGVRRHGELDTPADQERLATFNEALRALQSGGYTGLGFALGPDGTGQYWQGIDLDDVPNRPALQLLVDDLPGYTETSPSGTGMHAIGYGRLFEKLISNRSGIEAYAHKHFFTVTAAGSGLHDPVCLADFVEQHLKPLHSPEQPATGAECPGSRLCETVPPEVVTELRSALLFMRADDRGLWVRIGHALKTLGEVGRGLFLEWSATSEKFDPASDARTWESFKPSHTGYQAVFAEAQRRGWTNPLSNAARGGQSGPQQGGTQGQSVELLRASDIIPEPIAWLWNGWLAAGKMHIFGGAPGTGKTTIALALAATLSNGGLWPDGSRAPVGNVVMWSGEDDPTDTLIPRLILAGADLSRIHFVSEVRDGGERRSFDLARDMEPLRRSLVAIGDVRLLIVDPIVSAISSDSHKNAEVRRGLQPLVDLAATMRCVLLGITHFSKGTGGRDPVERLTGSLAFGALARVVLVAAKHQTESEDGRTARLFMRAKSNIGPDAGGYEYDLQQTELPNHPGIHSSSVLWGEKVAGTAREMLAMADTPNNDGENSALAEAKRFLFGQLANGPVPSKTIKADAEEAGHTRATIRRAQKALGIEAVKGGMKGGWLWQMPGQEAARAILESAKALKNSEDAQQKEVSTFAKIEHLHEESQPGDAS